MLLGQGAEVSGCGGNVVMFVPAPSRKYCQFQIREKELFFTEENALDLHCCTHGRKVGAKQLCVSTRAKAAQTAMVLAENHVTCFIMVGDLVPSSYVYCRCNCSKSVTSALP